MSRLLRGNGIITCVLILSSLLAIPVGRASAHPAQGLIAYWRFDEGAGSIVHDESGYGNHGVRSGGTWVPGTCGQALDLVRTDIVEFIPDSFDDPITTAFTIAGWVKWHGPSEFPPGEPRWSYLFDARSSSSGFIFGIQRDGNPFCTLKHSGGGQPVYGTTPVPLDIWTHIAAVFDAPSHTLRLYVGGIETDVAPAPYPYYDTYLPAAMGNNLWAPGDHQWAPLNGVLDELRIYNRALGAAEIGYLAEPGPSAAASGTWGAVKALYR